MLFSLRSSCLSVVLLLLAFAGRSTGFQLAKPHTSPRTQSHRLHASREEDSNTNTKLSANLADKDMLHTSRRKIMDAAAASVATLAAWGVVPDRQRESSMALAADATASDIFLKLRSIPTFCIVDPNGVPFMIFDGQASATGYFFLSFQLASEALNDARKKDSAKGAKDIWAQSKIIVVPLAVALQLALRKTQREAINNSIKFNTFNDIVPSEEGVEDAKVVEQQIRGNPEKWSQKGRVPLFYIAGLKLADGREPRYFNKSDLTSEWQKQNPGVTMPQIQIVELVDLYRNAMSKNDLDIVSNLAIMPVSETNQVASKLLKSSDGPMPSYSFSKVFLVGSSKG